MFWTFYSVKENKRKKESMMIPCRSEWTLYDDQWRGKWLSRTLSGVLFSFYFLFFFSFLLKVPLHPTPPPHVPDSDPPECTSRAPSPSSPAPAQVVAPLPSHHDPSQAAPAGWPLMHPRPRSWWEAGGLSPGLVSRALRRQEQPSAGPQTAQSRTLRPPPEVQLPQAHQAPGCQVRPTRNAVTLQLRKKENFESRKHEHKQSKELLTLSCQLLLLSFQQSHHHGEVLSPGLRCTLSSLNIELVDLLKQLLKRHGHVVVIVVVFKAQVVALESPWSLSLSSDVATQDVAVPADLRGICRESGFLFLDRKNDTEKTTFDALLQRHKTQ